SGRASGSVICRHEKLGHVNLAVFRRVATASRKAAILLESDVVGLTGSRAFRRSRATPPGLRPCARLARALRLSARTPPPSGELRIRTAGAGLRPTRRYRAR